MEGASVEVSEYAKIKKRKNDAKTLTEQGLVNNSYSTKLPTGTS